MATPARPGQFTGATDNAANGGLFTDTLIDGIPDIIGADVSAAQTSATNAATSESNAATSATNAATSATNAATSETNASTSETNAANSATAAANSATAAATSATNAATSATSAATSLADIGTSEANAAASATSAASSATSATSSANSALASASTATTKASEASTSATAAANSATDAAGYVDTFDDKYLGAKSTEPTVDNDGDALTDGALYFNTTDDRMKVYDLATTSWLFIAPSSSDQANTNTVATNITNVNTVATNITDVNTFAEQYSVGATAPSSPTEGDLWFDTANNDMKVYDGSNFVLAGSAINGTTNRESYVATAGQTSFNVTYDVGFVDVYLNGVKLVDGSDFTATNGTSITLSSGATLNDTVDIIAYGTFTLGNTDLNDLTDVNTGGVTNGDVLVYNSTSGNFEPGTAGASAGFAIAMSIAL
jgi:hypothetical protein